MAPRVLWAQQRVAHVVLVLRRAWEPALSRCWGRAWGWAGVGPILLRELLWLCHGVLEGCLNSLTPAADVTYRWRKENNRPDQKHAFLL